MRKPRREE